jgi:hypothetical protein
MTTIRSKNKNKKNKTKKNRLDNPQLKILKVGFPLFASKKSYGDKIIEYTKEQEKKFNDSCLFGNMSWFGDYTEAKSYKQADQNIYKWIIKKVTNLLVTERKNEPFIKKLFQNAKIELDTAIHLTPEKLELAKEKIKNENINCSYLEMNQNEKAFFEFGFAYGYITTEEQYQFMKLIKFLIEKKYVDIKNRESQSILKKINQKIKYYFFINKLNKKEKYNRLSIYSFDKYALNNLCKIMPKKYKIDGVFQPNSNSFWFPDLKVYKMNIKEYVLYNPHHNLQYDKMIE